MIDEQSSASGQDYASDRSAIGAGLIYICPDQDSIPVSQDTMIDEQSSASGHDYASYRSAIGAGLSDTCSCDMGTPAMYKLCEGVYLSNCRTPPPPPPSRFEHQKTFHPCLTINRKDPLVDLSIRNKILKQ